MEANVRERRCIRIYDDDGRLIDIRFEEPISRPQPHATAVVFRQHSDGRSNAVGTAQTDTDAMKGARAQ